MSSLYFLIAWANRSSAPLDGFPLKMISRSMHKYSEPGDHYALVGDLEPSLQLQMSKRSRDFRVLVAASFGKCCRRLRRRHLVLVKIFHRA